MNEGVTTTNPTLPPADALGGFLTSAWFAAREALILRGDHASRANEVEEELETGALVSAHLALLYSHLNRVPGII
jgi:hypothetical protein